MVIEGKLEVKDIFNQLNSVFVKEDNLIIRTTNFFLSKDETIILIETLVIENRVKNQFFAIISQREDGIVIRIYPGIEVEKTDGVKRSLVELGKQILDKFVETRIGKTNLIEFL